MSKPKNILETKSLKLQDVIQTRSLLNLITEFIGFDPKKVTTEYKTCFNGFQIKKAVGDKKVIDFTREFMVNIHTWLKHLLINCPKQVIVNGKEWKTKNLILIFSEEKSEDVFTKDTSLIMEVNRQKSTEKQTCIVFDCMTFQITSEKSSLATEEMGLDGLANMLFKSFGNVPIKSLKISMVLGFENNISDLIHSTTHLSITFPHSGLSESGWISCGSLYWMRNFSNSCPYFDFFICKRITNPVNSSWTLNYDFPLSSELKILLKDTDIFRYSDYFWKMVEKMEQNIKEFVDIAIYPFDIPDRCIFPTLIFDDLPEDSFILKYKIPSSGDSKLYMNMRYRKDKIYPCNMVTETKKVMIFWYICDGTVIEKDFYIDNVKNPKDKESWNKLWDIMDSEMTKIDNLIIKMSQLLEKLGHTLESIEK